MKTDLVVVGAGLAGLSAACRATQLGLRVVVLEEGTSDEYECNSRISGGNLHVAHCDPRSAPEDLAARIREITGGHAREDLVELVSTQAARAVAWLGSMGARLGRRGEGSWQSAVLVPIGEQGPGLSWRGRGGDVTLHELAARLRSAGGDLLLGRHAVGLLWEGEAVAGVDVATPDGQEAIRASSVLLADGGFQSDRTLLARFVMRDPSRVRLRAARTARGSGMRFAIDAGADLWWPNMFYGCLLHREALADERLWPYPMLDQLAIGGFVVDREGRRFVDEGRGGPFIANAVARLDDPLSATVICGADVWERDGRKGLFAPNPNLERCGAVVRSGESLEEVARLSGIEAGGLRTTADAYNAALASGDGRQLAIPRSAPSGTNDGQFFAPATPVVRPPFYAIPVCVGITYTTGGPTIDGRARVLRGGAPVGGLYAAGATSGGLEGGPTAGYVSGLMKALITGLSSAEDAVRRNQRRS